MEQFVPITKLAIRHYLTDKAYEAYKNIRQENDISVIGEQLTVYSKGVIDSKLEEMNTGTMEKLKALRSDVDVIANDVTNNITVKLNEVRANTYTKAEADEKERKVRADFPKELPANGGDSFSVQGKVPNNTAGNLPVLDGGGKILKEILPSIDADKLNGHAPDDYMLKSEMPTDMTAKGGNADTVGGHRPGNQSGNIALLDIDARIPSRFIDLSNYQAKTDMTVYVKKSELWSNNKLLFPDGTRMWLE